MWPSVWMERLSDCVSVTAALHMCVFVCVRVHVGVCKWCVPHTVTWSCYRTQQWPLGEQNALTLAAQQQHVCLYVCMSVCLSVCMYVCTELVSRMNFQSLRWIMCLWNVLKPTFLWEHHCTGEKSVEVFMVFTAECGSGEKHFHWRDINKSLSTTAEVPCFLFHCVKWKDHSESAALSRKIWEFIYNSCLWEPNMKTWKLWKHFSLRGLSALICQYYSTVSC